MYQEMQYHCVQNKKQLPVKGILILMTKHLLYITNYTSKVLRYIAGSSAWAAENYNHLKVKP